MRRRGSKVELPSTRERYSPTRAKAPFPALAVSVD